MRKPSKAVDGAVYNTPSEGVNLLSAAQTAVNRTAEQEIEV